jgi:hypothetical protein
MNYIYSYPKNLPASSIRFYRFPYEGVRESARLNLLLQSVLGDLRFIHQALEDIEDVMNDVGIYDYHNHPVEMGGPGEYDSNKSVHVAPISLTTDINATTIRFNRSTAVPKLATTFNFRTGYPQIGVSVSTKELTTGMNHPRVQSSTVQTQAPTMEPDITFNRPTVTTT